VNRSKREEKWSKAWNRLRRTFRYFCFKQWRPQILENVLGSTCLNIMNFIGVWA